MQPLNAEIIKKLVKLQKRVNTSCPLYPVEYDNSVCLTDNTIMIEWAKQNADLCEAYFDLYENCDHERSLWKTYEKVHWKKQFMVHDRTVEAVLVSMEEDKNKECFEEIGGAVAFATKAGRWYYHPAYLDMLREVVDQPTFRMYIPSPKQNMPKDIRMLCVYDGDDLIAVVLDQPVRLYR